MQPIPLTAFIAAPVVLTGERGVSYLVEKTSVRKLCELAEIPCRVSRGAEIEVFLHAGEDHYRSPKIYYVGIESKTFGATRVEALRALEILAHGFHDYDARESVCGRGLFRAAGRPGRSPVKGRAMKPAERMRKMRSKNPA